MKNACRRSTIALLLLSAATTAPAADAPDIVRLDQKAPATEKGKYPPAMVVGGPAGFDGSYKEAPEYESADRKLTVAIWESEAGTLQTEGYPHDEYCLVLEGSVIITGKGRKAQQFRVGDSFVIPKGFAGTWEMPTKFRKQFVAFEDAPKD